jgi:hypothetical protein
LGDESPIISIQKKTAFYSGGGEVVVEEACGGIDGDDLGLEIDVRDDLGDIGHEKLPAAVAHDEPSLPRPHLDPCDFTEVFTIRRFANKPHQVVLVVKPLGELIEALLREKKVPAPPTLGKIAITQTGDRKQPLPLVKADAVDLVKCLGFFVTTDTEADSFGQTFRKVGDDVHREVALDTVRFAHAAHDEPLGGVFGAHYSRISSTKRL